MSLIADSLKKAVKEESAPKWETDREINPVGNRKPLKQRGLSTVFRVLLVIVFPAAILVYLIFIGAFSLNKTLVSQQPDLPVSAPMEEVRVPSRLKTIPEDLLEKTIEVATTKPIEKLSVEEETVQEKETFVPKATTVLTTPEEPLTRKNEKTIFKKVNPPYPPQKKSGKQKAAVVDVTHEKAASSSGLKPASQVTPKIPATVAEKKIVVVPPPVEAKEKPVAVAEPVLEKQAVVPEETPVLKTEVVEILEQQVVATPEPPAKSTVEPVFEKVEILPEQKTAVAEKKTVVVPPPVEAKEKPVAVAEPVLEKQAVVPEETPVLKTEVVEIPEQQVVATPEPPVKSTAEPVLEKAEVSPKISDEIKAGPEKFSIKVQKKNLEIASLPSSSTTKPEIFRTDPSGPKNVFNNSDYYFNRGIFFQQAGDWQKALVNYSKSEELDPNNPDTYNNKGVVLKEMGKYDRALDEFLRAVFLDAGYAKAYNNIGVVYYMKKNYPEAIRHYLKAIDLNPTNLEAFNNLAIIYKKQKELDRARGVLNRALSLNPDHPGTNYNLAVLYEETSEIKPALHFYRRFIELGAMSYPSLVIQVKEHLEVIQPQ